MVHHRYNQLVETKNKLVKTINIRIFQSGTHTISLATIKENPPQLRNRVIAISNDESI